MNHKERQAKLEDIRVCEYNWEKHMWPHVRRQGFEFCLELLDDLDKENYNIPIRDKVREHLLKFCDTHRFHYHEKPYVEAEYITSP